MDGNVYRIRKWESERKKVSIYKINFSNLGTKVVRFTGFFFFFYLISSFNKGLKSLKSIYVGFGFVKIKG